MADPARTTRLATSRNSPRNLLILLKRVDDIFLTSLTLSKSSTTWLSNFYATEVGNWSDWGYCASKSLSRNELRDRLRGCSESKWDGSSGRMCDFYVTHLGDIPINT